MKKLRKKLHSLAELAMEEHKTKEALKSFFESETRGVIEDMEQGGFAVLLDSAARGPTVLFRAELDALPIAEHQTCAYPSKNKNVSHKCGHDGHMAILAGLGKHLRNNMPATGRVILMFQPAEETGAGALQLLQSPGFSKLQPDWAFALHNLPGFPECSIIVKPGPFASASRGMEINLQGETAHAAEPHQGNSPALAVSQVISGLTGLPQLSTAFDDATLITIIQVQMGLRAFGTTPGTAKILATLRSHSEKTMEHLVEHAKDFVEGIAQSWHLKHSVAWHEEFPSTVNNDAAIALIEDVAQDLKMKIIRPQLPFAWSEDFGHFTARFPGALFGIGAGENHPALHHGDYDFPDALLEPGVKMLATLTQKILG